MAKGEFPLPPDVKTIAELNKITQDVAFQFANSLINAGLDPDALGPFIDNWQNYNKYFACMYHNLIEQGVVPPALQYKMGKPNGK